VFEETDSSEPED